MKIACDRCLTARDDDRIRDWLRIRTDNTTYYLCEKCADRFWAVFAEEDEAPAQSDDDLLNTAVQTIMSLMVERDEAVMEIQRHNSIPGTAPLSMTELAKEIHENAVAHGWWDENRSFPEIIALCHSELSEALEEYRDGNPNEYRACRACVPDDHICDEIDVPCDYHEPDEVCPHKCEKPEGIAVELADCIIRILDYCGKEGIDIDAIVRMKHEYNKTRPWRHNGKIC